MANEIENKEIEKLKNEVATVGKETSLAQNSYGVGNQVQTL